MLKLLFFRIYTLLDAFEDDHEEMEVEVSLLRFSHV